MGLALKSANFFDLAEIQSQAQNEKFKVHSFFLDMGNVDVSCEAVASNHKNYRRVYTQATEEDIDQSATESNLASNKSVTINVEGWQLLLGALAILAGPYLYSWDAFGKVGDSVDDLRKESSASMAELTKTLREEMKLNRDESKSQFELLRKDMGEDRRNSTNAILDLQKQQGQLRP